ncbi:MAG: 2'-5' RNA ligase [Chloroflexi bacterium RBG_16_57_8]|nr:MAG: 2'-5' RNA ligase [Chloroflexi bacterium RBG_16_57_8]
MEEVRSFIAIELPENIKGRLGELQSRLQSGKSRARWVAPESIHLTLKFLGSISVSSIPDVTGVMEEAAFGIPPFRLGVRGLGVFPDARRVRVVWVGLDGELDELMQLQKRLDSGLASLGFAPESRPFTAHLTLARMRDEASPAEREAIGQLVSAASFEAGDFSVESVSLMKSQLTREGAIYSRLASAALTIV